MPYLGAMRALALLIIACMVSINVWGQQYFFQTFGQEDGIPVSTINDITEDPSGFMWIATEGGGLARFDGTRSEIYNKENGLPSDYVTALLCAEKSKLWIGTDKGLVYYDGFEIHSVDSIPNERVIALIETDGGLAVIQRRSVYLYSEGTIRLLEVPGNPELLSAAYGNSLYVGASDGLWKWDDAQWVKWWDGTNVRSIFPTQGSEETVQVGAEDDVYLVLRQNLAVANLSSDEPGSQYADVRDIVLDKQGRWWYGSYINGLRRYNANKPEGSRGISIGIDEGLSTPKIRCLHVSSDGRIWIGGLTGLSRLVEPDLFKYSSQNGLADERVHSVYNDNEEWWVGGLSSLTKRTTSGTMQSFGAGEGLPRGLIFDVTRTLDGKLFIATENGLAVQRGAYFRTFGPESGLGNAFIFDLEPLNDGSLGVATTTGIYRFRNNRFESIDENLISTAITRIREGEDGSLWAMDLEGRIMVLADDKWSYALSEDIMRRISPATFEVDDNGVLWMGTNGHGLWRLQGDILDSISQSEGLLSNNVWSLIVNDNDVWIGTELGIQNVTWNEQFRPGKRITQARGIGTIECNLHATARTAESVLFGTNTGLIVVPLAVNSDVSSSGHIELTGLELYFEQPDSWSDFASSTKAWTGMPQELELPYDQNYLRFTYSGLGIADPGMLQYEYRLSPANEDWIDAENRTEANYTSVAPGKYFFEVRAFDPLSGDQIYSEAFPFEIHAPFWKKWWFYVLLVLAIGGGVTSYVRVRLKRIQDRLDLEEERNELERRALRLQMNPHFVFNALDAISGFIFKNEPKEAVQYLNNFAKLMRLMLESSREPVIPVSTEIQLLENYLALEQLRFSGSFDAEVIVDEELDTFGCSMPSMMVQPHVENAILHGLRPKGSGKVIIRFVAEDEDSIICTVEDNGVGRARAAEIQENSGRKHRSLAGEISRRRVELFERTFGGRSAVETEDLYDDAGKATGTRITLHLPLKSTDEWDED